MEHGVRIIECRDPDDPGSEGRLLNEVFNLMEVPSELVLVTSIHDLLECVAKSKYKYIHIATHGVIDENNRFKGWWGVKGTGNKKALSQFKQTFTSKCIVSTACMSGTERFGNLVTDFLGARCYVAPKRSPSWHNAALFSHIFYFKLFRTEGTIKKSFSSYAKAYKNPHEFKLFCRNTT
jgi:hypothetical protein